MLHPTFEGIDVEREIILEELLGDMNERGEDIIPENHSRALIWPGHALGGNILGTEANIRRFSKSDLHRHHRRHYCGSNALLYFSGNITPEEGIALAERHFALYPEGEPLMAAPVEHLPEGPRVHFIKNDDSQDQLHLSFLVPAWNSPDYPAMVAIHQLLVEGISSRLQWNLRERLGMVYDIDAGSEAYFDTGVFDIDASAAPEKLIPLLREILRILDELREQPISQEELEKLKDCHRIGLEFAYDSPGYLASWMGPGTLYDRHPPRPEDSLKRFGALTVEDLQRVACTCFDRSRMVVVCTGKQTQTQKRQLQKLIDGHTWH
jgi:predicted Zn-dependent peptidase